LTLLDVQGGTDGLAAAYQEAVRRASEAAAPTARPAASAAAADGTAPAAAAGAATTPKSAGPAAAAAAAATATATPPTPVLAPAAAPAAPPVSKAKRQAQEAMLEKLVEALFLAAAPLPDEPVNANGVPLQLTADAAPVPAAAAAAGSPPGGAVVPDPETLAARTLLLDLARHLAFLKVQEVVVRKRDPALDTEVFVSALTTVLAAEDRAAAAMAEPFLRVLFESCETLLGSTALVSRLPVFDALVARLCSCCYEREWYSKVGGCAGIALLTTRLELGVHWLRKHETKLVRALLFVLKDLAPEVNVGAVDRARAVLRTILETCNRRSDEPDPHAEEHARLLQELVKLLLSDLANANATVRETVQAAFTQLATLTNTDVGTLLEPHRDRLLGPIFNKPLRALPVPIQIGHIEAITFCLPLARQTPLLPFDANLMRLLMEALSLADAEDGQLGERSLVYKSTTLLTSLRVACTDVLAAAMACTEFHTRAEPDARNRIIGVFFKSLSAPAPEVVEAGRKGLSQSIAQHRLPRELLQQSLRPVLLNLADPRRLDIHTLLSLSRLLELLVNCFNVALGEKLLEHLGRWTEPGSAAAQAAAPVAAAAAPTSAAGTPAAGAGGTTAAGMTNGTAPASAAGAGAPGGHAPPPPTAAMARLPADAREVAMCVAMLDVYHLLPSTAVKFVDRLVLTVLALDRQARRSYSSPFRPSLVKFLNRYPAEAVDYFAPRLHLPDHAQLWEGMLASEAAAQLRAEVMARTEALVLPALDADRPGVTRETLYAVVRMVRTMARAQRTWLAENPALVEALVRLLRRPDAAHRVDNLPYPLARTSKHIVDCLLLLCRHAPPQPALLIDMATVLMTPSVVDYAYVRRYLHRDVAVAAPLEQRRAVLREAVAHVQDPDVSAAQKTLILNVLVVPLLVVACRNGDAPALLDRDVSADLAALLRIDLRVGEIDGTMDEGLWIALLQTLTLLVRHSASASAYRRDLYEWGTATHTVEDVTAKFAGMVFLARLVEAEAALPEAMVLQLFRTCLRTHGSDARALVTQALDLLMPVIVRRFTPRDAARGLPRWVRLVRTAVSEEGHQLQQLSLVWGLVVRHRDAFFAYRNQVQEHKEPRAAQ
jgi:transformation/transcription domain-associated protein